MTHQKNAKILAHKGPDLFEESHDDDDDDDLDRKSTRLDGRAHV